MFRVSTTPINRSTQNCNCSLRYCAANSLQRGEARVSMLLKSSASLTCFRACFLPGRTKDLSAPLYRGVGKSLARPGRKQANVSVRMAWTSFSALPCRKKKTWWQLASGCFWNRARPWRAFELVSFLVGLRTYQHPGMTNDMGDFFSDNAVW